VNEAAEVVTTAADQNANVIFGAVIDEGRGDDVRVTVIATGFGQQRRRRPRPATRRRAGPARPPVEPRAGRPRRAVLSARLVFRRGTDSRIPRRAGLCDDSAMTRTVLIVDDHPSFRATARAVLEAEGFEVVGEARDGAEAVELAAALHPEVVLLDVQLPDQTGFEVAAALAAMNGSGPAIVLVSCRDAYDYGALIAQYGARGFVPKGELSGAAVRALLA
jgi:CheY-like chemotaxis protein